MSQVHLVHLAQAPIPTRFGNFDMHVFRWEGAKPHPSLSDEHLALVRGDVRGRSGVPVRIHSECLTSEVFGSLKCDCREQLESAQREVAVADLGAVLYLRQEGRGIGLANKVKAYALQAGGADTIEANEALHLPVDARTYDVAASMLGHLGIESIQLMTNNPDKVQAMANLGVQVEGRIPMVIAANPHSHDYLRVKRERMSHALPASALCVAPNPASVAPGRTNGNAALALLEDA